MENSFLLKAINSSLFRDIPVTEAWQVMDSLSAREKSYRKNACILHAGESVHSFGLILEGHVRIENDDVWGNKSILNQLGPGQVFSESYACVPEARTMVNVIAAEQTRILFFDTKRLLSDCADSFPYRSIILRNLLEISAQKNLHLSRRIFYTSAKSIRGRLLSYLSDQAALHGRYEFDIPFNRQQLADFLNVDRSALSGELSKMKQDGLIDVKKNHFHLYQI